MFVFSKNYNDFVSLAPIIQDEHHLILIYISLYLFYTLDIHILIHFNYLSTILSG